MYCTLQYTNRVVAEAENEAVRPLSIASFCSYHILVQFPSQDTYGVVTEIQDEALRPLPLQLPHSPAHVIGCVLGEGGEADVPRLHHAPVGGLVREEGGVNWGKDDGLPLQLNLLENKRKKQRKTPQKREKRTEGSEMYPVCTTLPSGASRGGGWCTLERTQ